MKLNLDIETNEIINIMKYVENSRLLKSITTNLYPNQNFDKDSKYECRFIGSWKSKSDVDAFFKTYNAGNNWGNLKLGNYVSIKDGEYDQLWVIAGFNCETSINDCKDGIAMIPKRNLTNFKWNDLYIGCKPSYIDSSIHKFINGKVKNDLSNILGNHIVERKVELGNQQEGHFPREGITSWCAKTSAYLTLMSSCQLGIIPKYSDEDSYCGNVFDEGEAKYTLPLFNYISLDDYLNSQNIWLRNVYGMQNDSFGACYLYYKGYLEAANAGSEKGLRPLIYLN